jgi:polyferredoxin
LPALPLIGGAVAPSSKMGRRRALVLLAVHVLIAGHIAWWWFRREAMTPLEPSEAAAFAHEGVINAGLVFFAAAAVLTLIFGRFFCGWACHVVALQDGCRWLLIKLGLRPLQFRSRLLGLVPLFAFFDMFLKPYAQRWMAGASHPGVVGTEWTTSAFWASFPSLEMSILTFAVCGFGMVWFLGSKGFCAYACPYGALFGAADSFAPGRIVVSDACEGCGHCTAVCTSNVRVHQEVKEFGMVVDAGCMKCMDCVSACPKEALSFGFTKPAAFAKRRAPAGPRPDRLSWPEDILILAVFAGSYLALHDLYGRVPMLLALALGGMTAFATWKSLRILRDPQGRFSGWKLKEKGRLLPAGKVFLGCAAATLLLMAHSGWVRLRAQERNESFESIRPWMEAVLIGESLPQQAPAPYFETALALEAAVVKAERIGLLADARNPFARSWSRLARGDAEGFEAGMAELLRLRPGFGEALLQRGLVRYWRGDLAAARDDLTAISWHDRRRPEAEHFLAAMAETAP